MAQSAWSYVSPGVTLVSDFIRNIGDHELSLELETKVYGLGKMGQLVLLLKYPNMVCTFENKLVPRYRTSYVHIDLEA